MSRPADPAIPSIPQSWPLNRWSELAAGQFPNDTLKARQLFRSNSKSLIAAGAVVRVGRQLVILGGPYHQWLASHASRVDGYEIAPNRTAETQAAA